MVDFSQLLSTPTDEIKRPPALPAGNYNGTITKYEFKESNEKKTPFVQFTFRVDSAGEGIEPADLEGIDLSKKTLRRDFYLTEDAMWRLKEFLDSFDFPTAGRSLGEVIPDTLNQPVLLDVVQQAARDPMDPPFNNVNKVVGVK